jgi:3-hydroxymyristoyl/3-hydroxydecanoyl-(acyl carrier protein) dehydratase
MSADLDHLLAQLPHQPPMRLVEEIVDVVPGRSARAARVARAGDWYFDGHFPDNPVVPAIALVELLAQTGGLAIAPSLETPVPISLRLASLQDFKFPAAAGPGAVLEATAEVVGRLGPLIKVSGTVTANGTLVASGSLTLAEVVPGSAGSPRA